MQMYSFLVTALWLLCCTHHINAQSACTSAMPYTNMQYLTSTQLATYKLTDPCSITCQSNYYGDFCEPNTKYAEIPQGPWNSKGYYTVGTGILKSMTLDVSTLTQVSYTNSDNTLVGVYRQQLSFSAIVLISLSSRTLKTVFTAPIGGTIDALQVRLGLIFIARSITSVGPFDVAILSENAFTGTYSAIQFMSITSRASMIEIVQNKGMNTTFVYTTANKILACTPDQTCKQWYSGSGVTGMVCGIDCPTSLYISVTKYIMRLSDVAGVIQSSTLVTHATNINCLASMPFMNTLLYRVGVNVKQYSSTATKTSTYDALLTMTALTSSICSLDVSESGAQIMLVESGLINTLEALQHPCDYGLTSPAVVSTSSSACVACPTPPSHAYLVVGSVTCEWQCYAGYTLTASQCVQDHFFPCAAGFTLSSEDNTCIPSKLPWAPQGGYVSSVSDSQVRTITPAGMSNVVFPIKVTSGNGNAFMTTQQKIYVSTNYATTWQMLTPELFATASSQCGVNTNNYYTMLGYHGYHASLLFVAFTLRGISPTQHCLWALDTTSVTSTLKPRLIQYWALSGQPCSVASDGDRTVFILFCNTHYILQTTFTGGRPSVLAGQTRAGYADGEAQSSWFNSPSSISYYNERLYVADRGNCVIREIDIVRGVSSVVAGKVGVCQRQDGRNSLSSLNKGSGLAGPYLLTNTLYDDYILFLDQGSGDFFPVLRQFDPVSGLVQTLRTSLLSKVSAVLSYPGRLQFAYGEDANNLYDIQASFTVCPDGTMSLEGNAYKESDCLQCGDNFYSTGSACLPCSTPSCTAAGQMFVKCAGNTDSYCGRCTNKPSNQLSDYTGPASAVDSGSDCPWVYLPPCPVSTYSASVTGVFAPDQTAIVCVNCPVWSTSITNGLTSVRQCVCVGGGTLEADNTCKVPSPYTAMPTVCLPLTSCTAFSYTAFPFPISETCTNSFMDTPLGVCRCQPGEYISQVYPKQCSTCPDHLYSPVGESCIHCPPYGEPSLDRSACRCAAGTDDIDLAEESILCVCGKGKGFNAQNGCFTCPDNQYSLDTLILGPAPWTQSKQCFPCAPGTFALPGADECSPCPAGTFRSAEMQKCMECPIGQYATDPTSAASCVNCKTECGGRKQTPCPTSDKGYVCVDCPPTRANAVANGLDNCATSCFVGYYELDGECVRCSMFDWITCSVGNILVPCSAYSDAACVPCENATKPLYYSRWVLPTQSMPSSSCAWECETGYTATSTAFVEGKDTLWTCAKEGAWSISDLFTV